MENGSAVPREINIDIINVTLRTYRKYQLNKHEKNGKIRIDFYR